MFEHFVPILNSFLADGLSSLFFIISRFSCRIFLAKISRERFFERRKIDVGHRRRGSTSFLIGTTCQLDDVLSTIFDPYRAKFAVRLVNCAYFSRVFVAVFFVRSSENALTFNRQQVNKIERDDEREGEEEKTPCRRHPPSKMKFSDYLSRVFLKDLPD